MRLFLLLCCLLLVAGCRSRSGSELTDVQRRVVAAVHEVDSLRSARAATISDDEIVDFETFARVCQPVGRRGMELAQANGWVFRQVSLRNRNPANVPDSAGFDIYRRFQEDSSLDSLWVEMDDGLRYYHRIIVEPSCLHCHGAAEERPRFVFERYPDDRAYGFEPGDLRGLYSIFVPDSSRRAGAI